MDQRISELKGQVAAAQSECNSKESSSYNYNYDTFSLLRTIIIMVEIKSLEGSLTLAEAKQQLSLVREEVRAG